MPNWLASELCMVASFLLGAWKTFKVLKHGGTDYNLLKTWCLLGFLRAFEEYFEFLVSWIPFYWLGKCVGLGLLYLPGGNIPTVVFERVVVWGMDNAHDVLNNLVVPNVVEFAVSLPWRVLLVLFPSMPPPPLPRRGKGNGAAAARKRNGERVGFKNMGKGALSAQLQHLNTQAQRISKTKSTPARIDGVSAAGAAGGGWAIAEGRPLRPPPLPPRSPPLTPTSGTRTGAVAGRVGGSGEGRGDVTVAAASKDSASLLVAQLLDANAQAHDDGTTRIGAAAAAAAAVAATAGDITPRRHGARGVDGEGTSPESSAEVGSGSSAGRTRRRRSFGEIFRSAVTGNPKVRVRDHLFDLGTASPAPPLPGAKNGTASASPEPTAAAGGSSSPLSGRPGQGGRRGGEENASGKATTTPRQSSASPVLDVHGGDQGSGSKRRGKKEGEGGRTIPAVSSASPTQRPKHQARRRSSEFRGGGGSGDEAGGGGPNDASSRASGGAEGGGLRRIGAGGGRRTLSERTRAAASISSTGGSSTRRSAAAAASRASAVRRGSAAGADVENSRDGIDSEASATATAAAPAIADSRARRFAEWRKKRAEKSNMAGGGADRNIGEAASGAGVGRTGVGRAGGSTATARSGAVTKATASVSVDTTSYSPPAKNRRFRHVERFRSEMARTGPGGSAHNPAGDVVGRGSGGGDASRAATAGSQQPKRALVPPR